MADEQRLVLLVPVDFSPASRRAMAWAYDYAQRAPCDVHMLHVVERHWRLADLRSSNDDVSNELDAVTKAAEQELQTMAGSEDAKAQIGEIHQHVAAGKATAEILRLAKSIDADMIVMGTHGLTGIEHALIGSVCEKVVRAAPCTVVAVKPH
jgi:nucleotide-binding universal stress UspA family protein